jgi:hypothetical protein
VLHLKPYTLVAPILYQSTQKIVAGGRDCIATSIRLALRAHYEALSLLPYVGHQIRAAQGPAAKDVIAVSRSLKPHDFVHGMRLRCGVAEAYVPRRCSCGHEFLNEAVFRNGHLLTCPHNYGNDKTRRHHEITLAIKHVLADYHIASVWEPTYLSSTLRPDLIVSARRGIIIDVTVVDSVLQCNSFALQQASEEKHKKYDKLAELHDLRFFPVAVDTYGGLHEEAVLFFERVARELNPHMRSEFKRDMRRAVQHALLKGNAQIAHDAVERLCQRTGVWY